ncbi:hypothetical protein WA158_006777 [Blastocystis sp. Blastoise]
MDDNLQTILKDLAKVTSQIQHLSKGTTGSVLETSTALSVPITPVPESPVEMISKEQYLSLQNHIARLQDDLKQCNDEKEMWIKKYKEISQNACPLDTPKSDRSTPFPITITESNNRKRQLSSKANFTLLLSSDSQCYQTAAGTTIHTNYFSNNSIRLFWNDKPKNVLIVKKENDEPSENYLFQISEYLNSQHMNIYIEPQVYDSLENKGHYLTWDPCMQDIIFDLVDFVITLGGDGTLLHVSSLFNGSVPPVVPFAMGTLGFLTPFDINMYKNVLNNIINDDFFISLRTRLCCTLDSITLNGLPSNFDGAKTSTQPCNCPQKKQHSFTVLNDIVFDRGENCSMVNLECYIGTTHITTVHADGLIIATPTGSTAYSMAAGGSMLHPSVPAMLLTPICPHTLSFRQMILPDSVTLRVEVSINSRTDVRVSYDGRHQHTLKKGQSIIYYSFSFFSISIVIYCIIELITVSNDPLPSVCSELNQHDWYYNVNESLNWNKQLARKAQLLEEKKQK